jgi:hypothetical protein
LAVVRLPHELHADKGCGYARRKKFQAALGCGGEHLPKKDSIDGGTSG